MHWLHGGGGEIENQILLCHRHHWMVHEGCWQLVKTGDGKIVTIAPTVTFGLRRYWERNFFASSFSSSGCVNPAALMVPAKGSETNPLWSIS